ncbi:MAG: hypothetical protein ANABAC_2932 [Anaerolineae bacterium]|nr:MAG: hypothetical protein ANABAC_2932 [Anaerolineae bacterium]
MIRLLRVRGQSLSPEIKDGDFVLALKLPIFFPIRTGDLIVFQKPAYGILIKRVEDCPEGKNTFWVRGTHPDSLDSRIFGAVYPNEVLGKVVLHLSQP